MDTEQLSRLSASLVRETGAISLQDLWSWQGLMAAGCLCMVALYARWSDLRRANTRSSVPAGGFAAALISRLASPGLLCLLAVAAYGIRRAQAEPAGLLLVLALLGGLMVLIRIVIYGVMRAASRETQMPMAERAAGWAIWLAIVLLSLKWLAPTISTADSIAIPIGSTRVSLLDVVRAMVIVLLFIVAASWLGAFLERRIMAYAGLPIGVRVGIGKAARVILVVVAVLLALTTVGMDLTALTVIGGAVGVGLGFGLQRIASNFISGFVLLGDRSIRPGDVITIGSRFGVVRELRARYVVVRDRDGVDTLIPNENLITTEVINWSYGDKRIRLKLPVRISFQNDPRQAMALMESVAKSHPRVEKDPGPAARVMEFSDIGIELELRFWIRDPEDGVYNVRSDLFLGIWDAFAAEGIAIPYPQRVVHLKNQG